MESEHLYAGHAPSNNDALGGPSWKVFRKRRAASLVLFCGAAMVVLGLLAAPRFSKRQNELHSVDDMTKTIFGADDLYESADASLALADAGIPGSPFDGAYGKVNGLHFKLGQALLGSLAAQGAYQVLSAAEWRGLVRFGTVGLVQREKFADGELDALKRRALSDRAAFEKTNLTGLFRTDTTLSDTFPQVCDDLRFRDQPVVAFCSGVLVGENVVLTAGHCMRSHGPGHDPCSDTVFVFGLEMAGGALAPVAGADVYFCSRVVRSALDPETAFDYALVQLDRAPLADPRDARRGPHRHVQTALYGWPLPQRGAAVVSVGHPEGLPSKVDAGGKIVELYDTMFSFTGDTFPGNSGGGVFDRRSGMLVGIVVRGAVIQFAPGFQQAKHGNKTVPSICYRFATDWQVPMLVKPLAVYAASVPIALAVEQAAGAA